MTKMIATAAATTTTTTTTPRNKDITAGPRSLWQTSTLRMRSSLALVNCWQVNRTAKEATTYRPRRETLAVHKTRSIVTQALDRNSDLPSRPVILGPGRTSDRKQWHLKTQTSILLIPCRALFVDVDSCRWCLMPSSTGSRSEALVDWRVRVGEIERLGTENGRFV